MTNVFDVYFTFSYLFLCLVNCSCDIKGVGGGPDDFLGCYIGPNVPKVINFGHFKSVNPYFDP